MADEVKLRVVAEGDASGAKEVSKALDEVAEKGQDAGEKAAEGASKEAVAAEKAQDAEEARAEAIETVAKVTTEGAKTQETAFKKVEAAAKKAAQGVKEAEAAADKGAKAGKSLNDSMETTGNSAEGTRKILQGMSQIMSGSVLQGVKELTEGVMYLNRAMLANPAGRLVAALSLLAGAWAVVTAALKSANEESEQAAKKSADLESGSEKAAAAAKKEADQLDKVSAALKAAADEAERFRKIRDELASAQVGLGLAQTDLAEARGEISPDEARARRSKIRADGEAFKNKAAITANDYEKKRALQEKAAAEKAAQDAAAAAYDSKKFLDETTQESLATGAPLELVKGEDFSAAKAEAAKRLADAKYAPRDEITGKSKDQAIAEAQAQVDAIDAQEAAFKRHRENVKAQQETEENAAKIAKETNKVVKEKNEENRLIALKGATSETAKATEDQQLKNDQEARKKSFEEQARKNRQKLIDDAQRPSKTGDKRGSERRSDRDGEESAEALRKSREIGEAGSRMKGRSPEATQRLHDAARKVAEGGVATEQEVGGMVDVVSEIAKSFEGVAGSNSKVLEQYKAMKAELEKLAAQVRRLNSQQGK